MTSVLDEVLTFRPDLSLSPSADGRVTISDYSANRHYMVADATVQVLQEFDGGRNGMRVLDALGDRGIQVEEGVLATMVERAQGLGFFEETRPNADEEVASYLKGPTRRNIVFLKLAEFNPESFLSKLDALGRLLFSKAAAVLLMLGVVGSGVLLANNGDRYIDGLAAFEDLRVWAVVYFSAAAVTIAHEFGHALAVTRFGGKVRRMGLVLYLLQPAAYTDTSDAWAFPRIRDRVLVTLGGVYAESLVVIGLIVAWASNVVPSAANNVFYVLAHVLVLRIFLNLNPFLRLDGYWLLSDVIGIPNLRAKAVTLLLALVAPSKFRDKTGFVRSPEERVFLIFYAVTSIAMLVTGVTVGLLFLTRWAERTFGFFNELASLSLATAVAIMVIISGVAYVQSLSDAKFLRS